MGRKIDFWMSLKKFSRDVTSILSGFFLIRIVLLLFRKDLDLFCSILVQVVRYDIKNKGKALCALLCLRLVACVLLLLCELFLLMIRNFEILSKRGVASKNAKKPTKTQHTSTCAAAADLHFYSTHISSIYCNTALAHHITQHKYNNGIFSTDGINGLPSIPKPPTNPSS